MAASVQQVSVTSHQELESTTLSYIAQGFTISSRTPDTVTLFKKKEFNVIWAVIGFFLCLLPLLVYCIVYATQDDQMIVIRVASSGVASADPGLDAASSVTWSEDRQWWWDGSRWRDTQLELPPDAKLAEDGRTWWDGVEWRAVPAQDAETGEQRAHASAQDGEMGEQRAEAPGAPPTSPPRMDA